MNSLLICGQYKLWIYRNYTSCHDWDFIYVNIPLQIMLSASLRQQLHVILRNDCSSQEVPSGWYYITWVFAALMSTIYLWKQRSSKVQFAFLHLYIQITEAAWAYMTMISYNFKIKAILYSILSAAQSFVSAMPSVWSFIRPVKNTVTLDCETHLAPQCAVNISRFSQISRESSCRPWNKLISGFHPG